MPRITRRRRIFSCWFCINILLLGFSAQTSIAAASGRFVATGTLTTNRQNAAAVLLQNGSVLIAGGDTSLVSAELYDPRGGLFSATGNLVSQMFTQPVVVSLPNGKALVTDGESANLYDPSSGTFSATAPPNLNNASGTIAAVLLQTGKVLLTDGTSAELYDPASGTITATGSPQVSRGGFTLTLLKNGKVLFAGGGNSQTVLAEAELYDPDTGTFSVTGSMTHARSNSISALIGGSTAQAGDVLIAGGSNQTRSPVPGAELYDPSAGQFTFVNSNEFANGLSGATATTLQDGRVLIAGGLDINSRYDLATIYDPSTGTFTETPYMVHLRTNHTATLLNDGKVLIAGGAQEFLREIIGFGNQPTCCISVSPAEVFDPSYSGFISEDRLAFPPYTGTSPPPVGTVGVSAITKPDTQWVNFYLDGNYLQSSPPYEFQADTSTLTDGPHNLMVIGFTNSPSRTNLGSDSVVVNVASHNVGIVNIPPGGPSIGCQPLIVQPFPPVSWVDNYLDGVYQNSSLNSCIDTTMVPNGIHTISTIGFASDHSVVGQNSVIVHVANAARRDHAFIVWPPTGSGASAIVPISVGFESGVEWVNLYVDGSYLASSPPLAFNLDTTQLSEGNHTISLLGFNSNGAVASDQIVLNVLN